MWVQFQLFFPATRLWMLVGRDANMQENIQSLLKCKVNCNLIYSQLYKRGCNQCKYIYGKKFLQTSGKFRKD
jgi:predicted nucleic acid-binding Zn finger protein